MHLNRDGSQKSKNSCCVNLTYSAYGHNRNTAFLQYTMEYFTGVVKGSIVRVKLILLTDKYFFYFCSVFRLFIKKYTLCNVKFSSVRVVQTPTIIVAL